LSQVQSFVRIAISAVVGLGSNFIERSNFTARHDAVYDKETDKSLKLSERFYNIPKEDVDEFEFQEYIDLHSMSLQDLNDYRDTQEEYKRTKWYRHPGEKIRSRGKVRNAKRQVQSSATRESRHVDELETYSRSVSSRCSSVFLTESESGLDLERSRTYRTDACSTRASGGSPPSACLEDIYKDENMDKVAVQVSDWLSSLQSDSNNDHDYSPPQMAARFDSSPSGPVPLMFDGVEGFLTRNSALKIPSHPHGTGDFTSREAFRDEGASAADCASNITPASSKTHQFLGADVVGTVDEIQIRWLDLPTWESDSVGTSDEEIIWDALDSGLDIPVVEELEQFDPNNTPIMRG